VRVPTLAAALAVVSAVWLSASLQRGGGSAQPTPLDVSALFVPQGFRIDIYAENVTGARQMALGAGGTLFVGSRQPGLVHAVVDRDGDFRADVLVLPDGSLLISDDVGGRILRLTYGG
jgi:glucose/arabinose dehydrogenase